MLIFVGLGNPGKQYDSTYHNVGFCAVEKLAEMFDVNISKKECESLIGTTNYLGEKLVFAKPQTFMNLSGNAVKSLVSKFGAMPDEVVVFVDDIDISAGTIRVREKGSASTHNGLRNITSMLGTNDFIRVRIGTGPVPQNVELVDFVLSKYPKNSDVEKSIDRAVLAMKDYICDRNMPNIYQKYNGNADL